MTSDESNLLRKVGQSVIILSPAKTVEPIDMPFGMSILAGQGTMY